MIRKLALYIFLICAFCFSVYLLSCQKWNLEGENPGKTSTSEALKLFSHKKHEEIFKKENVICLNCHMMHIPLENKNPGEASKLTSKLLYPGQGECHACHVNDKYARIANQKCSVCHKDMSSVIPDNHKVDWLKRHRYISRTEKEQCSKCHRDDYCNDCHFKRDTIRQRVHDRNFLFYHSVRARANPRSCVSCHSGNYCVTCHTERGVTQ